MDSISALNIVRVLRAIAADDRTLVATIHQPSSQMFELFDKLLLMTDGRIVYQGLPSEVAGYFQGQGFRIQEGYSIPDYCRVYFMFPIPLCF